MIFNHLSFIIEWISNNKKLLKEIRNNLIEYKKKAEENDTKNQDL